MNKTVKYLLIFGVIIATITLILETKKGSEQRIRKPKISTNHSKKIWNKEWQRFDYVVSECRKIIKNDKFLQARIHFWERYDVEPAVGYTAWLFQESRLNGHAVGDNGRAHGYGQIHRPALSEVNRIRKKRGHRAFTHRELRGQSRERLRFFLHSLHDYVELCERRYDRKRSMDADLNAWNGGGRRTTKETKYSGQIKHTILQYYKRKQAEEELKRKRASAKS